MGKIKAHTIINKNVAASTINIGSTIAIIAAVDSLVLVS
jgi:hypothetical protein